MQLCIECNKFSSGNEYCYKCYHKKLESLIVYNKNQKFKCVKCEIQINHPGYCERCYERNFPLKHNEIINNSQFIKRKPKCKLCNNEVIDFGFEYCQKHYDEFVKKAQEQSKKSYYIYYEQPSHVKYIQSQTYKNNYSYSYNDWQNYGNQRSYNKYNDNIGYQEDSINIKTYKSANGTIVKSKSECLICDFLTHHNINFEYEKPLYYSRFKKPLKPDFYIKGPHLLKERIIEDVYIEHLGGLNFNDPDIREEYFEQLKYKTKIYENMNLTIIFTFEDDMENYNDNLTYKLTHYKKNNITY